LRGQEVAGYFASLGPPMRNDSSAAVWVSTGSEEEGVESKENQPEPAVARDGPSEVNLIALSRVART
jgi:hypothetical protein